MALSNEAQAALIGGGLQAGGSIFSALAAGRMNEQQLRQQLGRDQADAIMAVFRAQMEQREASAGRSQRGLEAAGGMIGGPLDAAASRQQMALRRSLLFDGPGGGPQYIKPPTGVMQKYANIDALPRFDSAKPFFSDSAMLASEEPFWKTVGALSGGKITPTLEGTGYEQDAAAATQGRIGSFAEGIQADEAAKEAEQGQASAATQAALMQALGQGAPGAEQPEKKKGGFWRTLGKIASVAAPIVAAPFTGGASLAAIGAGAGAANAALSGGGVKGALLGGAMGGLMGGFTPGAGSAAAGGLSAKTALQQALTNPQNIAAMAGAALPGPAGQIAGLAGRFLPNTQRTPPALPSGPGPQQPATWPAQPAVPMNSPYPPNLPGNPVMNPGGVGFRPGMPNPAVSNAMYRPPQSGPTSTPWWQNPNYRPPNMR